MLRRMLGSQPFVEVGLVGVLKRFEELVQPELLLGAAFEQQGAFPAWKRCFPRPQFLDSVTSRIDKMPGDLPICRNAVDGGRRNARETAQNGELRCQCVTFGGSR